MIRKLKRIIILFLMIYIALSHIACYREVDKCHYREDEEDPISIELENILEREYQNKTILDKDR